MKAWPVKYLYFLALYKAIIAAFKLANEAQLIIEDRTIGNTMYVGDGIKLTYILEVNLGKFEKDKAKELPTKCSVSVK